MSNYCTHSQVGVLLNKSFDGSSTPTSTQVEDIIDQTTREIDVILEVIGITAQPTDTNLLATLEKYCSFGSAGVVGMTYFKNTSDIGGSNPEWYYDKYEKFLEKLRENPEIFGITSDADTMDISSNVLDGTYTESEVDDMFMDNEEYKF